MYKTLEISKCLLDVIVSSKNQRIFLMISALASKNSIFLCSHFKNDSCFKVSILKIVNFFRQNSKRQFSKIRTNCSFLREVAQ